MPRLPPYRQAAQIRDISARPAAPPAEIAVVIKHHSRSAKHANRRNIIAIASQRFPALSPPQAEKISAEIPVFIEASAAAVPPSAVPVASRWPRVILIPLPPAAFGLAGSASPPDNKNRSASAIDPETSAVHSPRPPRFARRPADLLLHGHLVLLVHLVTIFPFPVVGLAFHRLLCVDHRRYRRHRHCRGEKPHNCFRS